MLRLEALPARQGDALWLEWGQPVRRMIIDMGTEGTGRYIRSRIQDMPEDERVFELLIITHVDQDHIGGVLTCLAEAEPVPGLVIKDVWFNGWDHLHGRSVGAGTEPDKPTTEPFGPAQGERLERWLRKQKWNRAFGGSPVTCPDGALGPTIALAGDASVRLLGPTQAKLAEFIDIWRDEVEEALEKGSLDQLNPGLERYGRPPELQDEEDIKELALTETQLDSSKANGSSIALLFEHDDKRLLLAGDAHAPDLLTALKLMQEVGPVSADLVKLPHHGSEKNITIDLVEKLKSPRWLITTDGTRFKHPDPVAIARIIHVNRHDAPELIFNVKSESNNCWDRDDWRQAFGYRTKFGAASVGVTIEL